MKMRSLTFILLFGILASDAFSQEKELAYRRKITGIPSEGWYSIVLPNDIFTHLNSNLSDMRIYTFSEKDTLETPYVLTTQHDIITDDVVELNVINKSKKDGILYFTLEVQAGQKVNYLDLNFEQANYNAFITIQGSNDQKEWYEIADRKRILSIQNDFVKYSANTVNFPTSNYRYLKISVASDSPVDLTSASLKNQRIVKGISNNAPLHWTATQNTKAKQTVVTVTLDNYMPVNTLSVTAENDGDYYRNFSIDYVSDSSETPKGWTKFYNTLSVGYLTSINSNLFTFEVVKAKEFKLIINNQDNAPLKIKAIELAGPQVALSAKLKSNDTFLFYGNEELESPSYDLARFQENIPSLLATASLRQEENILKPKQKTSPLFNNKIWLWAIMGIMIAVLGFFTLRMVKNK